MSRETILANIRRARAAVPYTEDRLAQDPTDNDMSPGTCDQDAVVALFIERLEEYDARVVRAPASSLAAAIAATLASAGRHRVVVPPGVPTEWLGTGPDFVVDHGLDNAAIDGCDGVLTGSGAAVAESGSIALRHGPTEGRRVLTLLPDYHLCIVDAARIFATLPACLAHLERDSSGLMTFVSGPSATADIEMTRIRGVHGPRSLDVIVTFPVR